MGDGKLDAEKGKGQGIKIGTMRNLVDWRSEAISSFDVQRSMFDVHFFQSLLGKNNLALMPIGGMS